jgi:hypothetical protein
MLFEAKLAEMELLLILFLLLLVELKFKAALKFPLVALKNGLLNVAEDDSEEVDVVVVSEGEKTVLVNVGMIGLNLEFLLIAVTFLTGLVLVLSALDVKLCCLIELLFVVTAVLKPCLLLLVLFFLYAGNRC